MNDGEDKRTTADSEEKESLLEDPDMETGIPNPTDAEPGDIGTVDDRTIKVPIMAGNLL